MYKTIFGRTTARFQGNGYVEFQIPHCDITYVVCESYFFGFMQAKEVE